MARSAIDVPLLLNAIAEPATNESKGRNPSTIDDIRATNDQGIRGLRIGIEGNYFFESPTSTEARFATESALVALDGAGPQVIEISVSELTWTASFSTTVKRA